MGGHWSSFGRTWRHWSLAECCAHPLNPSTAFNLHQVQATKFCAGPLDPFYDDSKIGAFMYALIVEVESYGIQLTVVKEAR